MSTNRFITVMIFFSGYFYKSYSNALPELRPNPSLVPVCETTPKCMNIMPLIHISFII